MAQFKQNICYIIDVCIFNAGILICFVSFLLCFVLFCCLLSLFFCSLIASRHCFRCKPIEQQQRTHANIHTHTHKKEYKSYTNCQKIYKSGWVLIFKRRDKKISLMCVYVSHFFMNTLPSMSLLFVVCSLLINHNCSKSVWFHSSLAYMFAWPHFLYFYFFPVLAIFFFFIFVYANFHCFFFVLLCRYCGSRCCCGCGRCCYLLSTADVDGRFHFNSTIYLIVLIVDKWSLQLFDDDAAAVAATDFFCLLNSIHVTHNIMRYYSSYIASAAASAAPSILTKFSTLN